MTNEQIVAEAMANHDKHYWALVQGLKRKKKNAHDLADLIGEGSTVAQAIWNKYIDFDFYKPAALPSGEPPQPRCPECKKSESIDFVAWLRAGEINTAVECEDCGKEWPVSKLIDFAQFFGPSTPQPEIPKNSRRQMCTCTGSCRGAERLGPDWMCAMETCGICGWHKSDGHAPGCSQVCGVPSAPSGKPQCFRCGGEEGHLVHHAGKGFLNAHTFEPEGRAESAAEARCTKGDPDFGHAICPKHGEKCPPVVSASPAPPTNNGANPPKVEEIAEQVVSATAAILGPFFTQVSQPPTQPVIEEASDVSAAKQNRQTQTSSVSIDEEFADMADDAAYWKEALALVEVGWPTAEWLAGQMILEHKKSNGSAPNYDKALSWAASALKVLSGRKSKELAAPVTQVSGNGTEPPDLNDWLPQSFRIPENRNASYRAGWRDCGKLTKAYASKLRDGVDFFQREMDNFRRNRDHRIVQLEGDKASAEAKVESFLRDGKRPLDVLAREIVETLRPTDKPGSSEYNVTWVGSKLKSIVAGAASHNGQGWVRVEDRLPEFCETVLAVADGKTNIGYRREFFKEEDVKDWHWQLNPLSYYGEARKRVTHWQPLPAPPSGKYVEFKVPKIDGQGATEEK